MRVSVKRLANQEGQLVRILNRGGHPDSSSPIVIGMAEHEGEALEPIHGDPKVWVIDHVEADGVDGALADRLWDEEEVMPVFDGDALVNDGAGRGVRIFPGGTSCDSSGEQTQKFVRKKKRT